jgi:hypothetical protein
MRAAPEFHSDSPSNHSLMSASNLKLLSYSVDTREPFDGSHSVMTGDNRAHRISVIQRKITAIHLVSDQYFPLNYFV